jgi:hypothetical protein
MASITIRNTTGASVALPELGKTLAAGEQITISYETDRFPKIPSLIAARNAGTVAIDIDLETYESRVDCEVDEGPEPDEQLRVVTSADPTFYLDASQRGIGVCRAVGAATQVVLPLPLFVGEPYWVKDCKGDCDTNNITVLAAGGYNIDSQPNHVLNLPYGDQQFVWTGTEWSKRAGGVGGAAAAADPIEGEWNVAKDGNDITGNGCYDKPFLTMGKALAMVEASGLERNRIILHTGVYTETFSLTYDKHLQIDLKSAKLVGDFTWTTTVAAATFEPSMVITGTDLRDFYPGLAYINSCLEGDLNVIQNTTSSRYLGIHLKSTGVIGDINLTNALPNAGILTHIFCDNGGWTGDVTTDAKIGGYIYAYNAMSTSSASLGGVNGQVGISTLVNVRLTRAWNITGVVGGGGGRAYHVEFKSGSDFGGYGGTIKLDAFSHKSYIANVANPVGFSLMEDSSGIGDGSVLGGPTIRDSLDRVGSGNVATKEPSGFPNITDSTLSKDDGTLTASIDPAGPPASYDFFISGKVWTKLATDSRAWPDTEGLHYFYFDNAGILQTTQAISTWLTALLGDNALVATLYWDAANKVAIRWADERHGFMPGTTHLLMHRAFGARWISGGALGAFTIGAGGADAHAQWDCSTVEIHDEDLRWIWSDGSPQDLTPLLKAPVFYLNGAAGDWRRVPADDFPFIYSGKVGSGYVGAAGRLPYNQWTGAVWQLTEIPINDYVLVHLYATNDIVEPIIAIQGQASYNNGPAAQAGAEVELASLQNTISLLANEATPLGSVILQSNGGWANTPKARVIQTTDGADYVDFRTSLVVGNSSLISHGHAEYVVTAELGGLWANKPTTNLYEGRRYFDTGLKKPFYYNTGDATWYDAAAAPHP